MDGNIKHRIFLHLIIIIIITKTGRLRVGYFHRSEQNDRWSTIAVVTSHLTYSNREMHAIKNSAQWYYTVTCGIPRYRFAAAFPQFVV